MLAHKVFTSYSSFLERQIPWDPRGFYNHQMVYRSNIHYARNIKELIRTIDPIRPALIGCMDTSRLFGWAPACCKGPLRMTLCQQHGRQNEADSDRFRAPAMATDIEAVIKAAAAKGTPTGEHNAQMKQLAMQLLDDGFYSKVSAAYITASLTRDYGPLIAENWSKAKLGTLTALFLVDKPGKTIEIDGTQRPVTRLICDARGLNAWTIEPASFRLFTLPSVLQEYSNILNMCKEKGWAMHGMSMDLRHMFFQVPLPPQLAALCPLKIDDDTYLLPRAFPMGWKCSPLVAQAVTWALVAGKASDGNYPEWFRHAQETLNDTTAGTPRFLHLKDKAGTVVGAVFVLLDNVFFIGSDKAIVQAAVAHFRKNCRECNVWIKGEGLDRTEDQIREQPEVRDDFVVTITPAGETVEFCGITFGYDGWCVADKAFGAVMSDIPRHPTYRQVAAILGRCLWDMRVRVVDMLTDDCRQFMALYHKMIPDSPEKWDEPMTDLTDADFALLQRQSASARARFSRGPLPSWTMPRASEAHRCHFWSCDAAGAADAADEYFGRAAVYLGPRPLSNSRDIDEARMFCEPGARVPFIDIEELEAARLAIESAATMPGWDEVVLFVILEDNTTVESWLARSYADSPRAVALLRRIRELLGSRRRVGTIGIDTTLQFGDVGTRHPRLELDAEGRPVRGWRSLGGEAVRRYEATIATAIMGFPALTVAFGDGRPGQVHRPAAPVQPAVQERRQRQHDDPAATECVIERQGSLFESQEALAHCVSEDFRMSQGIAANFKKRFAGVELLKSQDVRVGGAACLRDEKGDRFIYYLVTKPLHSDKPLFVKLRESFRAMIRHMRTHGVAAVSVPQLGCGLDELAYADVLQMMKEEITGTGVQVTVYVQ
jgi:hypothetical protein